MSNLWETILNFIYYLGESTVNVVSRNGFYEPEEDVLLSEMLNQHEE